MVEGQSFQGSVQGSVLDSLSFGFLLSLRLGFFRFRVRLGFLLGFRLGFPLCRVPLSFRFKSSLRGILVPGSFRVPFRTPFV